MLEKVCTYRVCSDVKEAGAAAATIVDVGPAEEELLSMASNLGWCPCFHEVSRNPSPISFSYLL